MAKQQRRVPLNEKGLPVRKEDAEEQEQELAPGDCECPRLDPEDWDGVESDWSDISFVKTSTSAVLGVPIGYDGTRDELRKRAEKAGATVPDDAMLLNGSGKFRRPVMLEVDDVPDGARDIERPGGIAFTRQVEAPWGQLQKLSEQTRKEATEKYGREPDAMWVWYLTCRECSRARNFETLFVAHYKAAP